MTKCVSAYGHKFKHFTYSRPSKRVLAGTYETYAQHAVFCARCAQAEDLNIGDPSDHKDIRPGGGAERLK